MPDVNKRPQLKLPTIEVPQFGDAQSMISSITQIKEAIEIMSGVRGGKSYFPTYDDATLVQQRLLALENKSAWDVIYNQEFTGVNSFILRDLGEYRNLRGQLYITQDTGTPTWPYMRYLDASGAVVNAAGSYTSEAMYNTEGSATVSGFTDAGKTTIPLSLTNNLVIAQAYGSFNSFEIMDLNKSIQTVFFNHFTYYTGALIKGTMVARENGASMRTGIIIALATGATLMHGHLYLEGLKG